MIVRQEQLTVRADATSPDTSSAPRYDARAIVILPGLEAVRRNPSMYIGSTDAVGLHHLVFELVDNSVDEAEAGFCTGIDVTVHADGALSVADNGRGIPTDLHPVARRPACEVVLTTLHAGGKFEGRSYATSAGLHGIGVSCVNALAAELELEVWRDGHHYQQSFARGVRTSELERVGDSVRHGTRIWFRPDPAILEECEFSSATLVDRLEEVAFLHPGLRIGFLDERTGQSVSLSYQSGVRGFLEHRNQSAITVHPRAIVVTHRGEVPFALDLACQWTEEYAEELYSFVNSVRTTQGGTHVDGLRAALAWAINRYASSCGLLSGLGHETITAVDVLEGLTAVIALRVESPKFDGQTKRRLQNPEIGVMVQAIAQEAVLAQLEADEDMARAVVGRCLDATRARLAARLASRTARIQRRDLQIDYKVYQRQFGIRSRNWHQSCTWLTDQELLGSHAAMCDVPSNARMLDVCCGSGVVGNAFKGKVGESIGLDITPEMVALASTRLDKVHQGTVYDLPFPDSSFDLVVNREVLHLLPQPQKPVSEIFRVLRPGGQFIVGQIVPYAREDAFWMFRIFKKKQPLLFQMFLEEEFRALLLGAGFVDLKMQESFLWESIDLWIDTHETTPAHRQEIYRLYYDAPKEVRAVHPFEVGADGSVRDRWRWCVYSVRKPAG